MDEQPKRDKRALLKDLSELKQKSLQRGNKLPPPEGKNEQFLEDNAQKFVREAQEAGTLRTKEGNSNIDVWAKDAANLLSKKIRGAVTTIGGIGNGKTFSCSYCGEPKARLIGQFVKEFNKIMYKCGDCKKNDYDPNKSHLKIIIH